MYIQVRGSNGPAGLATASSDTPEFAAKLAPSESLYEDLDVEDFIPGATFNQRLEQVDNILATCTDRRASQIVNVDMTTLPSHGVHSSDSSSSSIVITRTSTFRPLSACTQFHSIDEASIRSYATDILNQFQ